MRLSYGTLTRFPVRPPESVDAVAAGFAMAWGWLLIVPVTILIGATGWVLSLAGIPSLAVGLVVVGLLQFSTRFMHADGLADTADGLGAARGRAGALEIMRKSDIGPFGVVTLISSWGCRPAGALPPEGADVGECLVSWWRWRYTAAGVRPRGRAGAAVAGAVGIPALVATLVLRVLSCRRSGGRRSVSWPVCHGGALASSVPRPRGEEAWRHHR